MNPDELERRGVPFVRATVVLAEAPTSANPGDHAIVLADGTMEGFVGGDCAESTVRSQALAVLDSGEAVLLRISPDPEEPTPGKVTAHNPCLSGGTLEIFLEPHRPALRIGVFGSSPIAEALTRIGAAAGYDMVDMVSVDDPAAVAEGANAVVVASHGRDEADVLVGALNAGVEYVGLVASPKRGAEVVGALDVAPDVRARVVVPVGLDIGARAPEEIAISILADVIARRPRPSGRTIPEAGGDTTAQAVDPICGMTVAAVESSLHLDRDGERFYFCGTGCMRAFSAG